MQYAMILPMNHAHTAVAGPPEDIGAPNVAGTDPNTPRMEIAYETVDHLEKWRRKTCHACWSLNHRVSWSAYWSISNAYEQTVIIVCDRCHDVSVVMDFACFYCF
jgi:hypothetical protein